jgi:hypothetical protein
METIDRLGLLRPLGVDGATFAVREMFGGEATSELLVAEWIANGSMSVNERYELLRRARALMFLGHSKLASIRDIVLQGVDAIAICNFFDGEWLDVWSMAPGRTTLGMHVRVMLDVLDAVGALHSLRDEHGELLGMVHGRLAPDAVLIGSDGVGRVTRACHGRPPRGDAPTVAPELRDSDAPATPAADIYAVGAMLRDALDQTAPNERWNTWLEAVIERACDNAPERRWPAASAMAMALRAASGPLPTSVHVSAFVRDAFGGRIRARRAALEAQAARPFALADVAQPCSSSVPPPRPSTAPSARLADEPKVQIAPAVLDPPTVPPLPSDAPSNNHTGAEVSIGDVLNDDVYRRRLPTIRIADAPASLWRLTDARGMVTAVAILVAFAIGCFLGGRAWFESGRPATPTSPTSPVVPRWP